MNFKTGFASRSVGLRHGDPGQDILTLHDQVWPSAGPGERAKTHPDGSRAPTVGMTVLYSPDTGVGNASLAGTAGSGGTTRVASTSGATTSRFIINLSWDASVASAPAGFQTAVIAAAQYLEAQFTDPVTININIGYGEVNGTPLASGNLGQSYAYFNSYGYSALRSALSADATSSVDSSFLASLPASAPVGGTFWLTSAEAKALGLSPATGTGTDGFVGFSSSSPFTYSSSAGVASGTYDFNGLALHEMTEVMGRLMLGGGTMGGTANSYDLLDLMHYSSAGARDFSASTPGYASADSGQTSLGQFNTGGGDGGDWASSVTNDALDALSASGVVNSFSANDVSAMDVLGWNTALAPAPTPTPTPAPLAPTGISIAPVTAALGATQTSAGLTGNAAIAKFAELGGVSGDSFTYSLGGSGASAFALASSSNAATLSTTSSGLAGGAGGRLYALTVTANDATNGTSSPASPLDVIVGAAGNDTVGISALTGSLAAATPTFVFGLSGADTINGAGMTGSLWIDGGAGADVITGGSAANGYLYSALADSTASAMDVITNFHSNSDALDLTGLGSSLSVAGKLKNNIPAHSVGWQSSGGNTFVYVNASGASEGLSASDMKIELQGSVSLGIGNFHHL